MKESTQKLCRHLQNKPDIDGNQRETKKHKKDLCEWTERLVEELTGELKYETFASDIVKELNKQQEFDRLREEEKKLNLAINLCPRVTWKWYVGPCMLCKNELL